MKILVAIIAILTIGFLFGIAHAASNVTFAWDAPPTTDNVVSTKIYKDNVLAGTCAQPLNQVTITGIPDGTNSWSATFVDKNGIESDKSNSVTTILKTTKPGVPKNYKTVSVTVSTN